MTLFLSTAQTLAQTPNKSPIKKSTKTQAKMYLPWIIAGGIPLGVLIGISIKHLISNEPHNSTDAGLPSDQLNPNNVHTTPLPCSAERKIPQKFLYLQRN